MTDQRILNSEFVVEASFEEVHSIWFKWCHVYGVSMVQDCRTHSQKISTIGGHPVRVDVEFFTISGVLVAFVNGIAGQVSDQYALDQWIKTSFPCVAKGERLYNAGNFGNVLRAIENVFGIPVKMRDLTEVEAAILRLERR